MLRQLGFLSSECRRLHDGLQLLARRCSYIIWVNRYNKDFFPLRLSISNSTTSKTPLLDWRTRAQANQLSALEKLKAKSRSLPLTSKTAPLEWQARAQSNRINALKKLEAKKIRSMPSKTPSLEWQARAHSNRLTALEKLKAKKVRFRPLPVLEAKSEQCLQDSEASKWQILSVPGLPLINTLNKCWFHASLHFLSCIPHLRLLSSNVSTDSEVLEKSLFNALYAIVHTHRPSLVHALFNEIKDFSGRNQIWPDCCA